MKTQRHQEGLLSPTFETNIAVVLLQVMDSLDVNIIMFLPTVVLGVVGGLLGGMFVFINLKLARLRQAFISKASKKWKKKSLKIMEPCLIIVSKHYFMLLEIVNCPFKFPQLHSYEG